MASSIEEYLNTLPADELRELRSKGGRTMSRKKELAYKIRSLEKRAPKNWKNKDTLMVVECMVDPDISIINLQKLVAAAGRSGKLSKKDQLNMQLKLHEMTHGTKTHVTGDIKHEHSGGNVVINMGIDMTPLFPVDEPLEEDVVDAEFVEKKEE